ncbi:hypothetical protein [Sphingomonas sp.]|jgi:hypothetical protein|uniref:hypothetical protein n=1 Tax=Sphingomonas sp. TaxID=28214 RepID=UPI002EDADC9C
MIVVEPNRRAELVANLHSPWRATVAECLDRWSNLDGSARAHSYIVVEGVEPGIRHTLNSSRIAELAMTLHTPPHAC